MAQIIPFSDIVSISKSRISSDKYFCLFDTNFIIGAFHKDHKFRQTCKDFFNDTSKLDYRFFVTHTARTEFLDIQRKYCLTLPLWYLNLEIGKWAAKHGKSKLTNEMREELKKCFDQYKKNTDVFKFLSDNDFKCLKQVFPPMNESGKVGWSSFCDEFLTADITKAWDDAVSELGINYLELRHIENELGSPSCILNKKLIWEDMVSLMGRTGVGSSDAMICNVFLCSKLPVFATIDFDIAYSLAFEKTDQFVAIPDSLYNEHKMLFRKISNKIK